MGDRNGLGPDEIRGRMAERARRELTPDRSP
jgi:hypothetical protein